MQTPLTALLQSDAAIWALYIVAELNTLLRAFVIKIARVSKKMIYRISLYFFRPHSKLIATRV